MKTLLFLQILFSKTLLLLDNSLQDTMQQQLLIPLLHKFLLL